MSLRALAAQIVQICIGFAPLSRTGSAALNGARAPIIPRALERVAGDGRLVFSRDSQTHDSPTMRMIPPSAVHRVALVRVDNPRSLRHDPPHGVIRVRFCGPCS
jgi:hypothetical protein